MFRIILAICLLGPLTVFASTDLCKDNTLFNIGAGIYDITGPAAEEGMMGYGMLHQQTAGIYQRLWARAFIIESPCNKKRVVFVNADLGQIFQAVKQRVIRKLHTKYNTLYTDDNVLLTATHTHSGPGGYATDAFYNITTLGFSKENFNVIVDGIVQAIENAHQSMMPAHIRIAKGELTGISFNRSPTAYLQNPASELARYQANVDTEMTLVRFDTLDNHAIGSINWFPVHGVSMNNKNHLITGDNKGYAAYLFEKDFQDKNNSPTFIAAFAQAHSGDVSPNPYGKEGGEGTSGLAAIEKTGRAQYEKAKKLYQDATEFLTGSVDFRHEFVAMDNTTIDGQYTNGTIQHTCPAAIGVSMLAGTQDGEGIGKQGVTCDNISDIFSFLACQMTTTPCQGAKPIAITTGLQKPYPWTPNILPLQLIKIGNLTIIAAPFELTTMTGRRLHDVVVKSLPENDRHYVTISALANAYAGYVATHEEYHLQRYEAASTHFGPWQQAALQQEFAKLAKALTLNTTVDAGPTPPDLVDNQINLQPGVFFDDKPPHVEFGSVHQPAKTVYHPGEVVEVVFWGGHPKNNFRTQNSYLFVEKLNNGNWERIRNDNDWDTEYHWTRKGIAYSLITVVWRIPTSTEHGTYRISHFGDWKSGWSKKIYPYSGYSSFEIAAPK